MIDRSEVEKHEFIRESCVFSLLFFQPNMYSLLVQLHVAAIPSSLVKIYAKGFFHIRRSEEVLERFELFGQWSYWFLDAVSDSYIWCHSRSGFQCLSLFALRIALFSFPFFAENRLVRHMLNLAMEMATLKNVFFSFLLRIRHDISRMSMFCRKTNFRRILWMRKNSRRNHGRTVSNYQDFCNNFYFRKQKFVNLQTPV